MIIVEHVINWEGFHLDPFLFSKPFKVKGEQYIVTQRT